MEQPNEPIKYNSQDPNMIKLKAYLINSVSREFDQAAPSPEEREATVKEKLNKVYEQTQLKLPESVRLQLFHSILDEMIGFGPIQYLLDDTDVSEVMVNRSDRVYIERKGKLIETKVRFENDDHVLRIIERIISPLGRRVDAESPMVDARLPDGSRVNAVIPPVAIDGPMLTIRKFSKSNYTVDQLIEFEIAHTYDG